MSSKLLVGFGKRLNKERRRANFSQPRLADKVGVSKGYISLLEAGLRMPSLDLVERFALALRAPLGRLLTSKGTKK